VQPFFARVRRSLFPAGCGTTVGMKRGTWLVLTIVLSAAALALVALKLRPPPPRSVDPAAPSATPQAAPTVPTTQPMPAN
jgi:hypothetical protein